MAKYKGIGGGRGNVDRKYTDDNPNLGTYQTDETQFPNPEGVKTEGWGPQGYGMGFGVDQDDIVRGFCKPGIAELPEYDAINYRERWTEDKMPDEEDSAGSGSWGMAGAMKQDFEFRQLERKTKGFLTRPRIPTDR